MSQPLKLREDTGSTISAVLATEINRCRVDAKYIDSFTGWTPSSVLEKHYVDYSPERAQATYDEAGITVLE